MPNFGSFGSETNGLGSSQVNELPIQNNGQIIQCSLGCNERKCTSNLASNHSGELANDSIANTPEKIIPTPRSTFFSRLARRLTVRRTVPKLQSVSPHRGNANSLKGVTEGFPPQIPTGRKIRRWFSKHLMPPSKNSLHKASPSKFSARAATLDGAVDKCVLQPADDFGSAPIRRRALPPSNLSGSSLCNSQTGTISLADEPFEAAAPVSAKQDNPTTQISSAFSSPSVTGTGPPPRYLNVSLAAFGYTGCNRKWGSVQTLERGRTAATEQASSSAFLGANVTPQRHKSTSPTSSPRTTVQRPHRLDLHDGQNPEAASTVQAAGASPVAAIERPSNSSGVAIRVKRILVHPCAPNSPTVRPLTSAPNSAQDGGVSTGYISSTVRTHNCSNATSITAGGEGDQSQDLNRSHHSHHEHWNRSSLIMLAVAQASPRTHNAPPSVAGSTANTVGRQSLSHNDSTGGPLASPSKPFSGRRLVSGEESSSFDVPLPKVEEVPSMNTTGTSQEEEAVASITGLEEAASSLALVNGHALEKNEEEMVVTAVPIKGEQSDEAKDGHYFLRVAEGTAQELRDRVEKIERDLNEHEFSDEVSGHLRTTVGKVKLLLSQKFVQFRGLCMDSIEAARIADSAGDFVTLPSDLEGFWAMVMLQVDDVRSMIAECDRLRQNDWQTTSESSIPNDQSSCLQTPSKTKRRQLKTAASPATVKSRQNKEAADLARSQARERLKAAKRQYMRARQDECNTSLNNSSSSNALDGENSTFLVL
ncbi:Disk large-associated protein 2 [Taenia solium]|eukprot:TsM_001090000 transcript=TsM_001090000 gene=TsM_001090000